MQPEIGEMWRYRFTVSGRVQGVFFRKFTKQKADEIGITGHCRNTSNLESVEGEIEGTEAATAEMVRWLKEEGSPRSVVELSKFDLISKGSTRLYNSFEIRK